MTLRSKPPRFIVDTAIKYDVDCIVMEYLDLGGRKRGSKKQRLHLWRAKYVQTMVTDKAHRNMIRTARVCAWNTSRLAFDGSGRVMRGKEAIFQATASAGSRQGSSTTAT